MRLDDRAWSAIERALRDAFSDIGQLEPIARCLDTRLQDIVSMASPLPQSVIALISFAERSDKVGELIACSQHENPGNRLLADLDFADMQPAPSNEQLVDAGVGAASFKSRLKDALANLDDAGMQLVAAGELSELLATASDDESDTLYLALLGNLKIERPDEVARELVPILAACLRRRIGDDARQDGVDVNLTRTRLRRIDLAGLDLHEADIAFADLRNSDLQACNLWRTRGYAVDVSRAGLSRSNLEEARWHSAVAREARFHDCRMISVVLKEADLSAAEFYRSRLQGAHFEGANLTGAHLEQANLADAHFTGATIDDPAAASISRALNWGKAHFDPDASAIIAAKSGD